MQKMKHETDDLNPGSRGTKRQYSQELPPITQGNSFNSYNQYGGNLPSSPPEYGNLYDDMNGNGVDPLHDELLQMCRATGIEDIAKDSGIIKNGEIAVLKDYSARDPLNVHQLHRNSSNINAVSTPISTISNTSNSTKPTPPPHSMFNDGRTVNHVNTPSILSHSNHKSNYSHHTPNHVDKSSGNESSYTITSPNPTTSNSIRSSSEANGVSTSISPSTSATPSTTPVPSSSTPSLSRQSSFQSPPTMISSGSSVHSSHSGDDSDEGTAKKRKRNSSSSNTYKADKDDKGANKGLRHFSLKVCQKVETKRTTSYNEVADELVGEIQANSEQVVTPVEQKNIRRRVYDVLNVLMAMNIISKDKKEIHWIGLPSESKKPHDEYKKEKQQRLERIKKKKENLAELMAQQVSYRNLLARNNKPDYSSTPMKNRIYLPFIVVNTKSQTVINCEVAHDRTKYFFNFSNPFEIYDDNEVLKRMGLGSCAYNDEPVQPAAEMESSSSTATSTTPPAPSVQFPRTNLPLFPP